MLQAEVCFICETYLCNIRSHLALTLVSVSYISCMSFVECIRCNERKSLGVSRPQSIAPYPPTGNKHTCGVATGNSACFHTRNSLCSLHRLNMEIAIANHTFTSTSSDSEYVHVSNRNTSGDLPRAEAEDLYRRFRRQGFQPVVCGIKQPARMNSCITNILRDK